MVDSGSDGDGKGRAVRVIRNLARRIRHRRTSSRREPVERETLRQLPHGTGLRIHVGAGPVRLDGWLNTDIGGSAEYHLDATKPWPLDAGSVAYVFSDNMIEHLTLDEARAFLREARAVMAEGAWLRIVTPDPGGVARAYLLDDEAAEAMTARHRRAGYRIEHRVDLLRAIYHENGHCAGYLFDEAALRSELEQAGFRVIRRTELGHSPDPVLQGLDKRTEPGDQSLLLAMEAQA